MNANDNSSRETINEEAALWHARLDSGTADEREFEAWRNADPRHAVAFARINATADVLDTLKGLQLTDQKTATPATVPSRRQLFLGAAGCLALAGGFSLWAVTNSRAQASTRVGDKKSVTLPDGSQLTLNTDSKASWKFDDKERRIWLDRGEIGVVVASDKRPCLIHAGTGVVRLTEGDLNARLREKTLDVTVLKGACILSKGGQNAQQVQAGEAALAGPMNVHVRPVTPSDLQFASGWRQGELVLDGQTLGVVIEEYNRYLDDKIVIADPSLTSLRLGGRFNTRDPKDFLTALQSSFGIHVSQGDGGSFLLSR